ncbi:MAG: LytTR family DNA-binding domain-containing protein [Flavobacteriales bacterium]|nr:LytTR family DNA-binding domain-containing protein [Flavobacteriales bacterium]
MGIKTMIIDDERLARQELKNVLQEYGQIEIIDDCGQPLEAKELIEKKKPELIFLDVQMPGLNGFQLLQELDYVPEVIFVTAYDEYALKAFEVNALDYIVKPVEESRLEQAIARVTERISKSKSEDTVIPNNQQVFIKDGDKCWFVELSDIILFESEGNYVRVYFDDNKPMILKSLNNLEKKLDDKTFFRANRQYIVNLKSINEVKNWFGGRLLAVLKNGKEIEVSRRQASKLKDMMSL